MAGDVKAFCTAKAPMIIFCTHLVGDSGKVAIVLKAMHPDPPSHLRTCPPIPVEEAQRQEWCAEGFPNLGTLLGILRKVGIIIFDSPYWGSLLMETAIVAS